MANELLKYLAMIPMVSFNTFCEGSDTGNWTPTYRDVRTTSKTSTPSITTNDLKSNIRRHVILNAVKNFEQDLVRLTNLVSENKMQARAAFSKAIVEINTFNPSNVIVGLTDSNSIYFRFYSGIQGSSYETHFELFYVKEEDFIEAVSTVYKNDKVVLKAFGTSIDVLNKIRGIINLSSEPQNTYALSY